VAAANSRKERHLDALTVWRGRTIYPESAYYGGVVVWDASAPQPRAPKPESRRERVHRGTG
jgi:hypothetical protein